MSTTDFSRASKQGRAAAIVVVEFFDQRRGRAKPGSAGATSASGGPGGASAGGPSGATEGAPTASGGAVLQFDLTGMFSLRPPPEPTVTELPGYVWHRSYRRHAVTGLLVLFDSRESAEAYRERIGRASAIARLLVAEPAGAAEYDDSVRHAEGGQASKPAPGLEDSGGGGSSDGAALAGRNRAVTDARAAFVGATTSRGPLSLLALGRARHQLIARMRRMPGYVWHTVYWRAPFTLGTIAFFTSRDELLTFARNPADRRLKHVTTDGAERDLEGYTRIHVAPEATEASTQPPAETNGST